MKQFKEIESLIDRAVNNVIQSKSGFLSSLAEKIANQIRKRTRLGFGVKERGGKQEKLAPLADSTKKGRQYAKKKGELNSQTTPNRSNLTRTGELLDSIVGTFKDGVIKIWFNEKRASGKISNPEVASVVSKARPFFELTKPELAMVEYEVRQAIEKELRQLTRTINKR